MKWWTRIKHWFKKSKSPIDMGVKQANWHFKDGEGHDIHLCVTFYEGKHCGTAPKRVHIKYWDYTLNKGREEKVLI